MSAILSLLVVLIISFAVVKAASSDAAKAKKAAAKAAGQQRPQGFTNYRPHKDIISVSRDMGDKKNSVLRDDKNNDWLAKQLEEEHRAFKATSEMFDLKIEHASHCDAKILEQFHKRHCTADGVDLANGSTLVSRSH